MKGDARMRFIGSKANLIEEIEKIILEQTNGNEYTFLDLFAGTNCVGNYFKNKYKIYSNDILYFSFINAKAIIENNGKLNFNGLKSLGINSALDYLSQKAEEYIVSGKIGYYEQSYTPTGNAMYLTVENGKRIDYIRDKIDEWKNNNLLTSMEYYYLVSVLIEAIPYVSNTTGTYGAFLKHWDKRALKSLELIPLEVLENEKDNEAFNEDANELIRKISVDIAYIDTPYNNRQYASNYHLLENVALNNKPQLNGKIKIFNWDSYKSNYSMKRKALETMRDLLNNIDATHIIISYNNEGIISEEDLIGLVKDASIDGNYSIKKIPYRKYKSKIPSVENELYEILIYFQRKAIVNRIVPLEESNPRHKVWKSKKTEFLKSPLNYIGGKYKLLKQIIPLFPKNINTFIDLFSGGANVGINVKANKYIFNDMNYKINEMFRFFKEQNPDELVNNIKERIREYELSKENEDGYLRFREDYNKNPNPLDLYVLVSFSYNYQFRFNNSMMFNNPFGRNRSSFSDNMEKNLRLFVERINSIDVIFTDELFTNFDLSKLGKDDFVYLDPPYLITTGNYNDGNRGFINWGEEQECQMYNLMEKLTKSDVKFALSNVITHKGKTNSMLHEFIKKSNLKVHYLNYSYKNSSYNTISEDSEEVLITNYDTETFSILSSNEIDAQNKRPHRLYG